MLNLLPHHAHSFTSHAARHMHMMYRFYKKKNLTFSGVVEKSLVALNVRIVDRYGIDVYVYRSFRLAATEFSGMIMYIHTQECLRRQEEGQLSSTSTSTTTTGRRPPSDNPPSSSSSFNWSGLQAHFPYVLECPTDPDVHHIVLRGLYAFSYEYFLVFFPPESLHVVTQEELKVSVPLVWWCLAPPLHILRVCVLRDIFEACL